MVRAIVFDCFGVLVVDGWLPFKRKYFGDNAELFKQATDLNRQTDAGLLGYDEYVRSIADMAGVSPAEFRKQIEQTVINEELLDYIEASLKPHYKIGMLSNVAGEWLEHKFAPKQRQLFDSLVLSGHTGFIKPDPRAYEAVLQDLSVDASDAIFTDDQERNCTAAEDIGMKAIVYKDIEQFKAALTDVTSPE